MMLKAFSLTDRLFLNNLREANNHKESHYENLSIQNTENVFQLLKL